MNPWQIGWIVAALQVSSVLLLPGLLWAPWTWFEVVGSSGLANSLMFVANILFIVLPIIAVVGLWRRKIIAFVAITAFPIAAWIFGAIPFPLLSKIFTSDVSVNNWIITVVNAAAVLLGAYLFKLARTRSDNTPHS